jgi:DNA-binding YbaB/EbfC family protein
MGKNSGFKGMPNNMNGLVQQAQKMKQEMELAQNKVKEKVFDSQSGGGMVKVSMNGDYQIIDLFISPDVIDPSDPEMLQDLLKAALSEAIQRVRDFSQNEMSRVTGGLNIPGLF